MDLSFQVKRMFIGVSLDDFINAYRLRNMKKMETVYKRLVKVMDYDMMNFTILVFLFFEKTELDTLAFTGKGRNYIMFDWLVGHVYTDFYATKAYFDFDKVSMDSHIAEKFSQMRTQTKMDYDDNKETVNLMKTMLKWGVMLIKLYKYSIKFASFFTRLIIGPQNMDEFKKKMYIPIITSKLTEIMNDNLFNKEDRENAVIILDTVNTFIGINKGINNR